MPAAAAARSSCQDPPEAWQGHLAAFACVLSLAPPNAWKNTGFVTSGRGFIPTSPHNKADIGPVSECVSSSLKTHLTAGVRTRRWKCTRSPHCRLPGSCSRLPAALSPGQARSSQYWGPAGSVPPPLSVLCSAACASRRVRVAACTCPQSPVPEELSAVATPQPLTSWQ